MAYTPPVYPAAIPDEVTDLPDRVDDIDWLVAARYNELKKELVAVMTELGTDPKASAADVKTRLAVSLDANGALLTTLSPTFVNLTLSGDLKVDGGDIGITTDTNLLQLALNALTVNGTISGTNISSSGATGLTFSNVAGAVRFANGASINELTNGVLTIGSAYPFVFWDMGAVDGRALYLRNSNGAGTGVYGVLHYYNSGHRYWSYGINGGTTNNFVISLGSDLTTPKLTISTAGNAILAGTLACGSIGVSGNVIASGRLASGSISFSTEGPTDNLNVAGINTILIDGTNNPVTIGGFVGGVVGQILYITIFNDDQDEATLEQNEAGGNQDIFLASGIDETTGRIGQGWVLICDGSDWYDTKLVA